MLNLFIEKIHGRIIHKKPYMLKTFMKTHTWKAIQQKMYVYARTKHGAQYMLELYYVEVYTLVEAVQLYQATC